MSEFGENESRSDNNIPVYDFTPEEAKALEKEAAENIERGQHHANIRIDWNRINTPTQELPDINIQNTSGVDNESLVNAVDTLKRCANVAGLFEKNEDGEIIMDSLKVTIVEDEEIDGDPAVANLDGIKINKKYLTREGIIEKNQ